MMPALWYELNSMFMGLLFVCRGGLVSRAEIGVIYVPLLTAIFTVLAIMKPV